MSAAKAKKLLEDNRINNWFYLWIAFFMIGGYIFFKVVDRFFGHAVVKGLGIALIFSLSAGLVYSIWKKTNSERRTVYVILCISIVLRLYYLILHSADVPTGQEFEILTDVYSNVKLPDAYQPLYYVAAGALYNLLAMVSWLEPLTLDILRLAGEYMGLTAAVSMYYILCELEANNMAIYLGTAMVAFQPGLIALGAEIKPDIAVFALLVLMLVFFARWNIFTDGYNFILMSATFGLAVMTDLRALIFTPVVATLAVINLVRAFRRRSALNLVSTLLQTAGGLSIWGILSFAYPVHNAMQQNRTGLLDLWEAYTAAQGQVDWRQKFLSFPMGELLEGFVNPTFDKSAWIYYVKSSLYGTASSVAVAFHPLVPSVIAMLGFAVFAMGGVTVITNLFSRIDAKKKVNIWAMAALIVFCAGYYVMVNLARPEAASMEFRVVPILTVLGIAMLVTGMRVLSVKKKLSFVSQLLYLFVTGISLVFCIACAVYGCLMI